MFPAVEQPPVIRHTLFAEEQTTNDSEKADIPEMIFKVTEPVRNAEPVKEQKFPEPEPTSENVAEADDNKTDDSIEEQLRKSRERIIRLKDLSMKLRNTNIQELENVPAYKRKEIALQPTPASNESQISKFSLTADNEGKIEIRNNNSFLHDNPD